MAETAARRRLRRRRRAVHRRGRGRSLRVEREYGREEAADLDGPVSAPLRLAFEDAARGEVVGDAARDLVEGASSPPIGPRRKVSDARGGAQAWAKLVRHGFGLAPASEGRPCQARLPRSAAGRGCDARAEHRDAARLAPLDEHNLALLDLVHPRKWSNPAPGVGATYDLVVVGAGAAGLAAATQAGGGGARTALVEASLFGGASLTSACVPAKALARAARCVRPRGRGGDGPGFERAGLPRLPAARGEFLPREDAAAASVVRRELEADGAEILTNVSFVAVSVDEAEALPVGVAIRETNDFYASEKRVLRCDALLVAAGRKPRVAGLGLDAAGVAYDAQNGIRVDGDADFGAVLLPWVTHTAPELAHVGLYERDVAGGCDVYETDLAHVDRAILTATRAASRASPPREREILGRRSSRPTPGTSSRRSPWPCTASSASASSAASSCPTRRSRVVQACGVAYNRTVWDTIASPTTLESLRVRNNSDADPPDAPPDAPPPPPEPAPPEPAGLASYAALPTRAATVAACAAARRRS
ncbi:dihydrolipoyl dehydrogenase [Aureococcus anophagefferens]|nr:dihydrolipoyl dehydrogenase [Aureococcus anophagefferens]